MLLAWLHSALMESEDKAETKLFCQAWLSQADSISTETISEMLLRLQQSKLQEAARQSWQLHR
jgi:hypothetical protein